MDNMYLKVFGGKPLVFSTDDWIKYLVEEMREYFRHNFS